MSLLRAFKSLHINVQSVTRNFNTTPALLIQSTLPLYAEPLKKKKKLDPQILKQRDERRRKKLEKQIRRLEKNARQLKPIDELEVPFTLIDENKIRTRPKSNITMEISEKRSLLRKSWAKFKLMEKLDNFQFIDKVLLSQQKALEELRFESESLYQHAIEPDLNLIPFTAKGPVATPPLKNYESPDGDYIDISKKWE